MNYYESALAGELDFADVRTAQQAGDARAGYLERANDESLALYERQFAAQFVANLDCDFA